MPDTTIEEKLEKFGESKLCLIVDDIGREERSVLVAPADSITADTVNLMITLSGGIIYAALSPERAGAFLLPPMSRPRTQVGVPVDRNLTLNMCVSVEAREGVTTGISSADRACTLRVLGEPSPNPRKLVKPGHIFPVEVREGGILVKNALPEAALDVVKLSGGTDAAAYIDMLTENGGFYSTKDTHLIAQRHGLPVFGLDELTRHRLSTETLVHRVAEAKLPTIYAGELRSCIYKSSIHDGEHLALIKGEIRPDVPVLTRVQPEITFTDVFGGSANPSRKHLHESLRRIGENGSGVLIYLRRPFRGQLKEQISALKSGVTPRSPAMMRDYGLGAQILRDLGVKKIELLTNSPRDLSGVKTFGIEIVAQRALFTEAGASNEKTAE